MQPDVTFPLQPPELQSCSAQSAALSVMHGILHDEIDSFCKQVLGLFVDNVIKHSVHYSLFSPA